MKILLVDGDRELGKMLSKYLTAEGFDTTLVLTGQEGVDGALSSDYTAMILDIMLPDMSGTDVLHQVRKSSRMPIIMLTAKGDNIDRVIGLEMGADDYMPKPCYPRELVARLRAVLRRFDERPEQPAEAGVASFGDLLLNPATRTSLWQGKPFDLTASEFNLLELLIRAPDRVVSKDDLSEKGWVGAAKPMIAALMCTSAISAKNCHCCPAAAWVLKRYAVSVTGSVDETTRAFVLEDPAMVLADFSTDYPGAVGCFHPVRQPP